MSDFLQYDLLENPSDIELEVYRYLTLRFPEWEAREGQLEVIHTEALALIISEIRELINDVPPQIFKWFGENLFQFAPIKAAAATGIVQFNLINTLGHTIPAGTAVRMAAPNDLTLEFTTDADLDVAVGLPNGQVTVTARETGAQGNGLSGAVDVLQFYDFIDTAVVVNSTTGGLDDEDDDTYNSRFSDRLRLLSDRPIFAEEVAVYLRTIYPEIARAVAIDLYDPESDTFGNEKTVAYTALGTNGEVIPPLLQALAQGSLAASRELNFQFKWFTPTYYDIDVTVTVVKFKNYTNEDIASRVETAIRAYLNPMTWGSLPVGEDPHFWEIENTIRANRLDAEIVRVEGVRYRDSLTFGVQGSSGQTTDLDLSGVVVLPRAGNIQVFVTE
jgi:hypothetical protein